ncbi:MAG TPA: hypothetical protein VL461_13245 [Dictyobacter sp.]|jgi:nicotinic acid mononucleotide adenylyltransferase|nr:hypothetical protein [Dictyobacter sp.]
MVYIAPAALQRMKRTQQLLTQLHPQGPAQAVLVPGSPEPHGHLIIFTGSFNPPTMAHLAMLKRAHEYAREHGDMHIYAAFTKQTINKEAVERPLLLDRLLLLQRLLRRRLPTAGIMLFNRGLYVEQAQALRASFRHIQRIHFLIGFDKIVQILDPRYYDDRDASLEELFSQAELLVVPRGNDGVAELAQLLALPQNQRFAQYIHGIPFRTDYRYVSSTQVRQGGNASDAEVPQEVRRFMRMTRAYAPPMQRHDGTSVDVYQQRVQALEQLLGPLV